MDGFDPRRARDRANASRYRQEQQLEQRKRIRALVHGKGTAEALMGLITELSATKVLGPNHRPALETPEDDLLVYFGPRLDEKEPLMIQIEGGYRVARHGAKDFLVSSLDMSRSFTLKWEDGAWRISFPRGFSEGARVKQHSRVYTPTSGTRL